MIQSKKTFLIGFSGGADSTAALLWMLESPAAGKSRIIAVHFNHHLRGAESDAEAVNAAKFASGRNVEFQLIDLDIAPGNNLEARARQARLEAWKKLCAGYEDPVVVTGHHQDDCIENMFLRIGRGSNVSGLTGLQLYAVVEGVRFFRPLLVMSREEIESFLRERGVNNWAVDSSNLACDFSRNVLRNKILPEFYQLFPGGRKAVVQTLSHLQEDAACLDQLAKDFYEGAEDRFDLSFWRLHRQPALRVRMLRLLCKELFGSDMPVSQGAVERFENMVSEGKSGICMLDEKRQLRIAGNQISLPGEVPPDVIWHWRETPEISWGKWRFSVKPIDQIPGNLPLECACFDAGSLPEVLAIGAPLAGEKFLPFGRSNPVKIKELRIKRGIAAFPVNPVLRIPGNSAVFLPGIRQSGWFAMRPGAAGVMISAEKIKDFD